MNKFKIFFELSKSRMVPMVLITTSYGFFLSGQGLTWNLLVFTLLGMTFLTAGSATLNNYLERETDSQMDRTKSRVLPSGKLKPSVALAYGILCTLLGVFLVAINVNILAGFLCLLASFLYVLVYTPMKRWSWMNTYVGAIPGALPPMIGWVAATGELSVGAWVLFGILYTWQIPHFFALAIMYRDDYAQGGHKMLPVVDGNDKRTLRHILLYAVLLLLVSILPYSIGMSGSIYFIGCVAIGMMLLGYSLMLFFKQTHENARRLFKASLVYLPVLLGLFIMDLGL